jgi:hypothetical protein
MFSLKNITRGMQIPLHINFNHFDVTSTMSYCSELWGFSQAETLERLHRKYLKWTLDVKMSTNSYALYGETGRRPLI